MNDFQKILDKEEPNIITVSPIYIRDSQYKIGEFMVIWGKRYDMIVKSSEEKSFTLQGNKAIIEMPEGSTDSDKKEFLIEQLIILLKKKMEELIPVCEEAIGHHCKTWEIHCLKNCWGSCRADISRIKIDFTHIYLPAECLESTIKHELLHFVRKYHGKGFDQAMDKVMPSWEKADYLMVEFVKQYIEPARKKFTVHYYKKRMTKNIGRLEGYEVSRKIVEKYYNCQYIRYTFLKHYSLNKFEEKKFKLCLLDMRLIKKQANCLKTIFQKLSSENLLHRFEFFFPDEGLEPIRFKELIQQLDDIINYYSTLIDKNRPNPDISVDREVFLDNYNTFISLIDSLFLVYVGRETSPSGEDIVFYLPSDYMDKLQDLKIEVV